MGESNVVLQKINFIERLINMYMIIQYVLLIEFALCQESTTGDYSTVIYDPEPCECVPIPDTDQCYYPVPCSGCLPYDGSIVPDCSKYFDGTLLKQPYYKEHSNNCSRYWECGFQGYTCLLECALCGGPSNTMCDGQWSLTFDPSFQYPIGPVYGLLIWTVVNLWFVIMICRSMNVVIMMTVTLMDTAPSMRTKHRQNAFMNRGCF